MLDVAYRYEKPPSDFKMKEIIDEYDIVGNRGRMPRSIARFATASDSFG